MTDFMLDCRFRSDKDTEDTISQLLTELLEERGAEIHGMNVYEDV